VFQHFSSGAPTETVWFTNQPASRLSHGKKPLLLADIRFTNILQKNTEFHLVLPTRMRIEK
jgi:hypothetical protein